MLATPPLRDLRQLEADKMAGVASAASFADIPLNFPFNFLNESFITLRGKERGYKFFSESYFHSMTLSFSSEPEESFVVFVDIRCHRSMRKSAPSHTLLLKIGSDSILDAHCSCTAGLSGHCSHTIGLVFLVQHCKMTGLKYPPADLSKTSLPQQWHIPRRDKITPVPVTGMVVTKSKQQQQRRKRKPVFSEITDNRKIFVTTKDLEDLKLVRGCPISYLANEGLPSTVTVGDKKLPLGTGLSYHLPLLEKHEEATTSSATCSQVNLPISTPAIDVAGLDVPTPSPDLSVSQQMAEDIQLKTQAQHRCPEWHQHRKGRITASMFHRVTHRKKDINDKFVKSIMFPKSFSSVSTSYGIKHEDDALQLYVKKSKGHIHDCGFVINPLFSFLGATPDGITCESDQTGIVEVKCPYTARDMTIKEAVDRCKQFCLSSDQNDVSLSHTHPYYTQIQGQLLVTGVSFCDFVVFTKKDIFIERILPDVTFMKHMLSKLSDFYTQYVKIQ